MAAGQRWTRDELLVALNLYHKLTFGQLHARNPAIIALAEKLGRGANSVAMKLCNFASLDPALALRGIKGLEGASMLVPTGPKVDVPTGRRADGWVWGAVGDGRRRFRSIRL
jgi:hypothetical protein